jgi:hypothetical protein
MKTFILSHRFFSLGITALLVGLVWRLELEYHGWAGLTWLTYTHYAIPAGFLLFMVWANLCIQLPSKKRALLNALLIVYTLLAFYLLVHGSYYIFSSGPEGMMLCLTTPVWKARLIIYSTFALIPGIPVGAYFLLRVFRLKVRIGYLVLSALAMLCAPVLSIPVLQLLHDKGSADFPHTVKSGVLIVFWVFSLGLLVIGIRKKQAEESGEKIQGVRK